MSDLAALLGAREKELSAIYENVPGIVFYIAVEPDGEFRFLSVSQDFLTATGLSREQVVGSLVRDVIPPPSRDMVLNRYREAIRSGRPVRWEEKSTYPAGQRYGEVAVTPVYDASGVATHLIGIVHDITERKLLEERRAEGLLEAAPDAMVVVDQTGNIVLVNAQTERMFGYGREEMLGRSVELLVPTRFHERHQAHRAAFFSHPQTRPMGANLELFGVRKDGTEFPVEISLSPIQTAEGILVTSAIRDISERKMAEESRLRLAAIVESSEDAIISKNLDSIITTWNAAAQRIFGYTEAEAVGQPISILVPPEIRESEHSLFERLMAGERIDHYQTIRVTKTGKRVHVSLTISPIWDSTGRIVGFSKIARDITVQRRVEDALRASEERLRLAQQAARFGTFERDLRTGNVSCSGDLDLMYGLPPGTFEGTTTEFFVNLIHPDDQAQVIAAVDEALKTGQPTNGEWRVIWPDGSQHWIAGRWQVFMDESGEPSRMIGVNGDVTERRLVAQALVESEERLRLAHWAGHVGTFDLNLKTGVNIWQPETEALYGLRPGEFGGTLSAFEELIHPEDRERIKELSQEMIRTGQPAVAEWRTVWPDGSLHWIAGRGQVLMDEAGKPSRMVGVNMDITERKLAEETIKESEERFRLVADKAPVMIWMSGVDRKPTYFNQPWLDFTGLSSDELQNNLAGIVHPEDYAKCHEDYCRGFDQRQPFKKQCRLRRHDGEYRWMLDIGVPRFYKDGSFAGYIGTCIDETDHKLAAEALSGVARKMIEAQERERTRIARELHDDINQRLALLSVGLERLQEHPSEIRSRMKELRRQMVEVSNDVQSLAHDLHSSNMEYLGVVAGMKSWCREFAERHNFEIVFRSEVPGHLPRELGVSVFRVLQEAMQNVVKHSGAKRADVHLRVSLGEIQLDIKDSGRGFDIEAAQRGNGLGLISMRERVRLLNGTIAIDSKPMAGTTIRVRVPLDSVRDLREAV